MKNVLTNDRKILPESNEQAEYWFGLGVTHIDIAQLDPWRSYSLLKHDSVSDEWFGRFDGTWCKMVCKPPARYAIDYSRHIADFVCG